MVTNIKHNYEPPDATTSRSACTQPLHTSNPNTPHLRPMVGPMTQLGRLNCAGQLIAEDDEGDVEYKWRLTDISASRFEHLKTQMQFRVSEGSGRCLYEIGVADNGQPRGLSQQDFDGSVDTVRRLAASLGFFVTVVYERVVATAPELLRCAELMVMQSLQPSDSTDLRIAFCGNTGSGKSTLVSVLVHGELDDGQGFARQGMFNHKHEIDSGRTSSVAARVLGFDETGKVTNYDDRDAKEGPAAFYGGSTLSAMENNTRTIASRSVKLVTLMDLGGDSRYSKTTLLGFTSRMPGYACVCVAADSEAVQAESEPYIALCAGMRIPFFIVLTKADTVSEIELDDALFELSSVVEQRCGASCALTAIGRDDSIEAMEAAIHQIASANSATAQGIVPVLTLSSVDGEGMEQLKIFLHALPMPEPSQVSPRSGVEVLLDTAFTVSGVGLVLGGFLARGRIRIGDVLFIGPDRNGRFSPVSVEGVHVKGSHVPEATAGMEVSISVGTQELPSSLDVTRKGNVLVDTPNNTESELPSVCYGFEAQVEVLTEDTVRIGQEPVVHCRNIRQAVRITSIIPVESTGPADTTVSLDSHDFADVVPTPPTAVTAMSLGHRQVGRLECKFLYNAELLDVGSVVVMRWSRDAKLIGRVTKLLPLSHAATPVVGPAVPKRQPSPPLC